MAGLRFSLSEYRAAAKALFADPPDCTVADHAAVQPCADGGAFVEMTVWVSEEDMVKLSQAAPWLVRPRS